MEGMIWNAHHVLEHALLPGSNGIPKTLFKACVGVVLISVVEVGFVFSGSVGTGILLKKNADGETWSPPNACGLTGVGWGLLVGGSVKDLMIFILDEQTLESIAFDKAGMKIGAQVEMTLGPLGRAGNFDAIFSEKGIGNTISIAFSKGAFLGLNIEGAIIGARHAVNKKFYGQAVTPAEIFDGKVEIPADKVTLLDDVYEKLDQLAVGATAEPENEEKKQAAAAAAEEASAEVNKEQADDIVEVDATAEAAKES